MSIGECCNQVTIIVTLPVERRHLSAFHAKASFRVHRCRLCAAETGASSAPEVIRPLTRIGKAAPQTKDGTKVEYN